MSFSSLVLESLIKSSERLSLVSGLAETLIEDSLDKLSGDRFDVISESEILFNLVCVQMTAEVDMLVVDSQNFLNYVDDNIQDKILDVIGRSPGIIDDLIQALILRLETLIDDLLQPIEDTIGLVIENIDSGLKLVVSSIGDLLVSSQEIISDVIREGNRLVNGSLDLIKQRVEAMLEEAVSVINTALLVFEKGFGFLILSLVGLFTAEPEEVIKFQMRITDLLMQEQAKKIKKVVTP